MVIACVVTGGGSESCLRFDGDIGGLRTFAASAITFKSRPESGRSGAARNLISAEALARDRNDGNIKMEEFLICNPIFFHL